MKDIRHIIKKVVSETVDPPKSEDEKRFVAKHEVEVIDYPAGSTAQFKSKTKKDKTTDKKPSDGAEEGSVYEETMTDAQKKKREEIVLSMKKKMGEFKDRYGDKAKDVMYATATKQAMKEETELSEDVLADLKKIVSDKQAGNVKFSDGDTMKVDTYTASALMKIHDALNAQNKSTFANAVNKNETVFMKMVDFAFSKLG